MLPEHQREEGSSGKAGVITHLSWLLGGGTAAACRCHLRPRGGREMPWLLRSFHPPTSCECLSVQVRDKEPGKHTLQGPDPHNMGQRRRGQETRISGIQSLGLASQQAHTQCHENPPDCSPDGCAGLTRPASFPVLSISQLSNLLN